MTRTFDVAVIGAGVFGAWIAHTLRKAGNTVVLVDAYGPGNSRASSGGETRIIRMSYGTDELYARWSVRSLVSWKAFFSEMKLPLFHRTGVLWLAGNDDAYTAAGYDMLHRLAVPVERMSRLELEKRYPHIALHDVVWGFLEPESGALMARQAVQAIVDDAKRNGVDYVQSAVTPPSSASRLQELQTTAGTKISAGTFVFACGPWLPRLFPDVLAERMFITRQEVFFFGVPSGETRFAPPQMPIWLRHGDDVYGFPDLDSRGFKVSFDRHGPPFDPDRGERVVSAGSLKAMRDYVALRFPALKDAPIVETRVCQYENTWNGDFLIDRHPAWDNVWLVGGGSGHGFKHGPMVGEYVAQRIAGVGQVEPRFSLATKQTVQRRAVY